MRCSEHFGEAFLIRQNIRLTCKCFSDNLFAEVNNMSDHLFSDVCAMYDWTHSVKETAEHLGLSCGKVRKILITEGYDMGNRASQVKQLADKGMKADEIADLLKVSMKSVNAYMPYIKGAYLPEERSADALRSKRYREKRTMLEYSDRVLNPNGDYGFVKPSSRDILITTGFFQFNLSRLIKLTEQKESVRLEISLLSPWLTREEETFDEPPIVLEFNPTVIYSSNYISPPETKQAHFYKLLNCRNQVLDAAERGESSFEVYLFQMEEYIPYITKHFREFARYWNEKLGGMIQYQKNSF